MIKPHTCFSWGKGFFLQKRQQLLEFALTGKLYPLLSATTRFSEVCVCRSNKDDKLLCTGQKTRNTHTHTHTHTHSAMLFRICLEIREVALFRRNYLCTYPIKKKNRRCNLYSEQHFFFFFFGLPSMAFYVQFGILSHPSCCLCTYSRANNKHMQKIHPFCDIHSVSRHEMMTAPLQTNYLLPGNSRKYITRAACNPIIAV
jgi:hypothetical protein